jgi:hypothetical protein
MRHLLRIALPLLLCGLVSSCADLGGGYSTGYSTGYQDPFYYNGRYYYEDIYVPSYPGDIPDRPDRVDRPNRPDYQPVRPSQPIARPDRPTARPLPSIPTRARPMGGSSYYGGLSRGGGMGGGGLRGARGR